jgi:small-conductance mechanosensitive channel
MDLLRDLLGRALQLVPTAVAVAAVAIVLFSAHRLLERTKRLAEGGRFRNQLIMLGLTFVGGLVVILVLPIGDTLRGQLLSLIGILASAAIALSSTTVLGNALAGLMLRVMRNFRMGDFIRVGEHFGRVSERGLFHTEVQNEFRELITLPNLYVVTHPVTTIRSSGTLIWTTVSLSYDVPRTRVERLMLEAAEACGLEDSFVHIDELGDYSVAYRVAGMLKDVKQLISMRSRLRECVLDALHRGGVEIVSPTFMNTRAFAPEDRFIPELAEEEAEAEEPSPEDVVFDKAEEAASQEALQYKHDQLSQAIESLKEQAKKSEDQAEKKRLEKRRERLEAEREGLAGVIEAVKSGPEERKS